MPKVFNVFALIALASIGLSGCIVVQNEPQPQTTASGVSYQPFGPRQPTSGYSNSGGTGLANTGSVFGTSDEVSVNDSGPFPNESMSLDGLLDDQGEDPFSGDLAAEQALLAGVSLPGDDGSRSYFDSDVGAVVYFSTNSSELSEEARETLRKQAAWLQLHPDVEATVEGHADERGTREYNVALGERRASSVRGYLTALGIDGSRVRKVSFGKERPAVPGSDEFAWSQNRRAETVLNTASGVGGDGGESLESVLSTPDDPLLDPSLDELLGTEADDPLSGDIPANPLLDEILTDTGS